MTSFCAATNQLSTHFLSAREITQQTNSNHHRFVFLSIPDGFKVCGDEVSISCAFNKNQGLIKCNTLFSFG